jgi:predicted MFS family arabinose efflux permease
MDIQHRNTKPLPNSLRLYPWQIIAGLSASVFVLMGICLYSFIFLSSALAEELNWSATQTGGLVSAMWLVAPLALFCAPIIKRYGPWALVVIGVATQAVSLVGMVYADAFAELYILRILMGFGKVVLMVSAPIIIARYFEEKFGTALSIFWAFASGSGMVMGPLTEHLIGTSGWRSAAISLAVVALGSLLVTATFYFSGRKGYLAQGGYLSDSSENAEEAKSTRSNWRDLAGELGLGKLIAVGLAVIGTGVASVALFSHISGLMKQAGFDSEFLGLLVSILSITAVIGALVIGWMMDKLPPVWSALSITTMVVSGLLFYFLMLQAPSPMLAMVGTASIGLGLAAGELMWINLVRRAVTADKFSTAYGGWYFAIQTGYASGGALAGLAVDRFQGIGLIATMLLLYIPAMIMSVRLASGEDKSK